MNILIFMGSTGGGHKRAAAAIEAKIKSISPDTTVNVVDALRAVGKIYDKTVCKGYHFMATKIPKFYGECYKITDRKNLVYKAVMRSNALRSSKLLDTIEKYNPDIIISCHPFVSAMLSRMKRKGQTSVKVISLITDYDSHRTYIASNIDAYVIAEPQMKTKLVEEYGVPAELVHPLGIPTFDGFTAPVVKEEICEREGLDPKLPIVLLMAGSFGVKSVLTFYENLAKQEKKIQVVVITGNNKKLYDRFQEEIPRLELKSSTKLLFFVNNVEDYMRIADLIVTKPGGLTVTESLACGLPMVIYSAFPGQERDNVDFLLGTGAAVFIDQKNGAQKITELLSDSERLEQLKSNCRKLAQPNAAENIFKLAKELCEEEKKVES